MQSHNSVDSRSVLKELDEGLKHWIEHLAPFIPEAVALANIAYMKLQKCFSPEAACTQIGDIFKSWGRDVEPFGVLLNPGGCPKVV